MSKMLECCVLGCKNRYSPSSRIKFFTIPSGNRPFQVKRRRLWTLAIQEANGCSMDFHGNVRICGSHFVSGEASMDEDRVDFVPSVFTYPEQEQEQRPKKKKKRKRFQRRLRKFRRTKSLPLPESRETPQKSQFDEGDSIPKSQDNDITMDTEEEPAAQNSSPQKSETTEEVVNETDTTQPQTASSPKQTLESLLGPDKRNPVVLLKTITAPSGGYQCELCGQIFTDVSEFIKHKQLYDEQKVCVSVQPDLPIAELPPSPEVELSFPCNMCDRSFPTSQNLKRHKLLHVKDGRKCSKCGVLFCRRHNHLLFQPQTESKTESDEESSSSEGENLDSSLSSDFDLLETAKLFHSFSSSPPSPEPDRPSLASLTRIPSSESVKPPPVPRPPSPIFSMLSNLQLSPSVSLKSPDYLSLFVQPHLPHHPELPDSLKLFSPQNLTSVFLDVQRNYKYIMSKPKKLTIETVVKKEPEEQVTMYPKVKTMTEVKTEKIAYDLEIEI